MKQGVKVALDRASAQDSIRAVSEHMAMVVCMANVNVGSISVCHTFGTWPRQAMACHGIPWHASAWHGMPPHVLQVLHDVLWEAWQSFCVSKVIATRRTRCTDSQLISVLDML